MSALVFLHVTAGGLALVGGYVALLTRKGGRWHLGAGMLFVYAMLLMGGAATLVAVPKGLVTALGGPLVAYLVITATITVRPPTARTHRWDRALMIGAWVLGSGFIAMAAAITLAPTGQMDGVPAAPCFLNGAVSLLGAVGDMRVLRRGPLRGRPRLARHLWRMCFALFVAAGSFFLGQQQVIPRPIRVDALLITASVLPLLLMFYWLLRLRPQPLRAAADAPAAVAAKAMLIALVLAGGPRAASVHGQSLEQARALFTQGRYAEARVQIQGLAGSASSGEAAYYLGRIALAEDNEDDAVRQLERAVRLADDNAVYHYWLGRALYLSAPHASKLKLPGIATRVRREWERAVALDNQQLDARAGLAEWYAMAPSVMGGGRQKAADQAAFLAGRDPLRAALARAAIAEHEGKRAAEEAAYEQAIVAAPDTIAGYAALAEAYVRWSRSEDAFAVLQRYAERRPQDRWTAYYAGRLAGISGQRLSGGEEALREFLRSPPPNASNPEIGRAHYWLGRIARERGDRTAARQHYNQALDINPNSKVVKRGLEALR